MNPTRLVDTMPWLEKHVHQTCHGKIPALTGPYNMEVLKATKAAYKSHLLEGLKGKTESPTNVEEAEIETESEKENCAPVEELKHGEERET